MSNYSQKEFDFIERTRTIIEQYDSIDTSQISKEKYEVTLFINCLMGLIVLPQQVWFDKVPNDDLEDDWFIKEEHIIYIKKKQKKD